MVSIKSLFLAAALLSITSAVSVARGDQWIRREGRHIRLITDLESPEEADTIVATFDAAVDQWSKFWGLSQTQVDDFQVDAFVMRDKDRFAKAGLIPPELPDFPFGYTVGSRIWALAQQSEYYTRHLVLHEGIHSLAYFCFQGAGATWFQEGTAELLSTHRAAAADVIVNVVPADREAVPYWGRFKRMAQSRADQTVPTLAAVMGYPADLSGDVETYGWSWAAAMMFSRYSDYQPVLVQAARSGNLPAASFNRQFQQSLSKQWPIVEARWRVMCHDLDYGFDWSREQVSLALDDPKWDGRPLKTTIAADRGWQSCGVRVPGGISIRIAGAGQVTLADEPKPWTSEPAGITYQYHRGRPLGQLLVAVLPNAIDTEAATVQPLNVKAVSDDEVLSVEQYSWLLFRVNDAVHKLDDNRGHYEVTIELAR
jgi:hypothetical protein